MHSASWALVYYLPRSLHDYFGQVPRFHTAVKIRATLLSLSGGWSMQISFAIEMVTACSLYVCVKARQAYSSKTTNSLPPLFGLFSRIPLNHFVYLSLLRAALSFRPLTAVFSLSYGMVISLNFCSKLSKSLSLHDSYLHRFKGTLTIIIWKSGCPHDKNTNLSKRIDNVRMATSWSVSSANLNFRTKMSESEYVGGMRGSTPIFISSWHPKLC